MNNQQLTNNIINLLKEKQQKDYDKGKAKREAHAKGQGLLKAKFIIEDLDTKYKVGIFKQPTTYKALIRISNSITTKDNKKDLRGFAIKLIGVEGKKVLQDEKHTQDFVLISGETMPLGTLQLFHDAIYYMTASNPLLLVIKLAKNKQLHIVKKILNLRKNPTSPLDIEYFSTTPYMFSNQIVKYKITPTSTYKSTLPKKLTSTYLRDNMEKHLMSHKATFDFLIQFKTNDTMPINDASVKWESPYIKLATIEIEPQVFATEKRDSIGENLSFQPGHSLIDHKPVGELNEARMEIYKEMSKFRNETNGIQRFEPDENMYNNI